VAFMSRAMVFPAWCFRIARRRPVIPLAHHAARLTMWLAGGLLSRLYKRAPCTLRKPLLPTRSLLQTL